MGKGDMPNFSASPWEWIENAGNKRKSELMSSTGVPVLYCDVEVASDGHIDPWIGVAEDDGRLICAAPEMLALLKQTQWKGLDGSCLFCWKTKKEGHKKDCRLAALFATIKGHRR